MATRSGLCAGSPGTGPRELYSAMCRSLSVAPTVIAPAAQPGEPIVPAPGPEFPAATHTRMPSALSASTSRESGSVGSPGPPSERLITSTFWRLAQESAARTVSSVPPPIESAFATISVAFGATPRYTGPAPATIPATWVPWPTSSSPRPPVKSRAAAMRSPKSGWRSAPVSTMAMRVPFPRNPDRHTGGIARDGTLSFSSG